MDEIAIKIEHVSKEYRLGAIGGGTLRDLLLGLPPFLDAERFLPGRIGIRLPVRSRAAPNT